MKATEVGGCEPECADDLWEAVGEKSRLTLTVCDGWLL